MWVEEEVVMMCLADMGMTQLICRNFTVNNLRDELECRVLDGHACASSRK
jgi:hypothetical protein